MNALMKSGSASFWARKVDVACPVCSEKKRAYLFVIRGLPIARCPGCGLISLSPAPSAEDLGNLYAHQLQSDPRLIWTDSQTERESVEAALRELRAAGLASGSLLLVAPPDHIAADVLSAQGFILGQHISAVDIEHVSLGHGQFDAAVVLYQLENVIQPNDVLARIHASLKPGGHLLLAIPSTDSWPARFFGAQWTEWRPENRFYFNAATIQSLLLKSGFEQIWITPDRRSYTLEHVHDRARAFPRTALTTLVRLVYGIMPGPLRRWRVSLNSSGVFVTARRAEKRTRPLLSIVLPAFNEHDTFAAVMDALLQKDIEGLDKEVVVIESNSKDGTRELAQQYADHPQVNLVLEDRPKGKGHAVRTGFTHARGDIILIQDADLEYDLNDYEAVLEPIMNYRAAFVLGSRHGGSWKMRHFSDQPSMSTMLNVGHIFFTTLMNVLYGQRMQDPFTMYKVFRRDCLYGLRFERNRFDFDHELVIKLVRKGYTPLEVPVNYSSRSFKEGKKVTLVGDPISWVITNIKLRFEAVLHRPEAG